MPTADRPLLLNDLRLPLGHSDTDLIEIIARTGRLSREQAGHFSLIRKSIDARKKDQIFIQYAVRVGDEEPLAGISPWVRPVLHPDSKPGGLTQGAAGIYGRSEPRPVVAGLGPAGLFAALYLARAGLRPLVLERGAPVEQREQDVASFWAHGSLNTESNVQFGEGGAGTFSDGKLNSGIKDPRCRAILEQLVLAGAPPAILYQAKPHIGTDQLRKVVANLRRSIIDAGGEVCFHSCLQDIVLAAGRVQALVITTRQADGSVRTRELPAHRIILSIGHSARDTFAMLEKNGVPMQAKPFSLGVRIEHRQNLIDRTQYGRFAGHPQLPPAEYKLAVHLGSGRSVYTFCMCPGGQVIASASEAGGVVTNGMSALARDGVNANSALLTGVSPADFPEKGPLGGVALQRYWEQMAFRLAGGRYQAPAQHVGDFLQTGQSQAVENPVDPSYRPGVQLVELRECLPDYVTASLREALPLFERKLKGFASPQAMLTGVETRSSSPVRILRGEDYQSACRGLFPCGEGAGYAGGILSAAADGLRCAEALAQTML